RPVAAYLEDQLARAPAVVVQLERAAEVARLELLAHHELAGLLRHHGRVVLRHQVQLRLAYRFGVYLVAVDHEAEVASERLGHDLAEVQAEAEAREQRLVLARRQ